MGLFRKANLEEDGDWAEARTGFLAEQEAESKRLIPGQILRWSSAFALFFAAVFFFFWWSGRAIEFGAARVGERPVPTWKVVGLVLDNATGQPVPWASVKDSPNGRPPFFEADADPEGRFELLTLAESHRVLVEAHGYRPKEIGVGRQWFVWWPKGQENVEIRLIPE